MSMQGNRAMVGVVSDRRMVGIHPFHMVGEKYLAAVADAADSYPVSLPSMSDGFDVLDIVLNFLTRRFAHQQMDPERRHALRRDHAEHPVEIVERKKAAVAFGMLAQPRCMGSPAIGPGQV